MTRWSWKAVAAVAATGGITAAGAAGAIAASADSGDAGATRPVIVVLKDQATTTRARGADRTARVKALQAPLQARVRDAGGSVTHAFTTLNGFSATVSADGAAALARDPAVAEVVPDSAIPAPRPAIERAPGATPRLTPGGTLAQAAQQGICPADPAQPLLEPQALESTKATQANQIADGSGVKVAFVADGVDTTNPDFQRPDGSPVFTDYKDFSGDGTAAPTEGAEAFGDASSIAAQGNETYDLSTTANPALPAGCTIRVKGVAPGASLVGIKVFPEAGSAQTSTIIAGADYAVNTDGVDVLNYSLGSNPLPDEPALDALKLFNQNAVKQGVTVTISSGDAGVRNSVGSPAGEPGVITLGASTDFRNYGQTGYGGATFPGVTAFAADQLSQISSGGVTQNGSVVDLVAPGESGWAVCSTDQDVYEGCGDLAGRPSPVQSFGGTSQSAPLAAGAAAVVIDAYRRAHGGVPPTPALVKQLLTGSADDLHVPSREQGAGLLDVAAAARAASSVHTADGTGDASKGASGVVTEPTQLDVAGPSGTQAPQTVTVTNTSPAEQVATASLRTLSPLQRIANGTVSLTADAPTFPDLSGSRDRRYRTTQFDVPEGVDRLESRATWSSPTAGVRLALIAPDGTYTAFSRPQGVSDFTEASVARPAAGTWTALIFTTADPALAAQPGFVGDVSWSANTASFVDAGTPDPTTLTLAPGASGKVTVPVSLPQEAGDSDQDLVITTSGDKRETVVPVVRRSLVRITDQGGGFTGTVTAGNGRGVPFGETDTVSFDVPQGKPALGVQLDLANDAEQVLGFLVDPDGNLVSNASNVVTTARETKTTTGLALTNANPKPGRWRLIVQELAPGSGTQEELPYQGTVTFGGPAVTATGLPTSADVRLPAGKPVVAHVQVANGGSALAFALDPRTATASDQRLVSDVPDDQQAVPDPTAAGFNYTVPPATDRLGATASADQPITFDLIGAIGNPDLVPSPVGGTELSLQYASPNLAQGPWAITPEPYAKSGFTDAPATPGTVTASLTAHTLGFDRSVATSTGDPWLAAVDAEAEDAFPQVLAPGRTGTLDATITPKGEDGTVVKGTLYVTTYDSFVGSGDIVAALPYEYTIGEPVAETTPTTPTTTVTTPGETVTTPGVPVPTPVPGPTVTVPAPTPAPTPSPALTARTSSARVSGRTATVRLTLSRRASVKVTVTRNGRTVARAKARTLAAGERTVRFALNTRLARGTYRLTVTAQVGAKVSRSTRTVRVR